VSASHDGNTSESTPHSLTTIFLRPIGGGLPLGFFSFGVGMLVLACQAIGWIPEELYRISGGFGLALGALAMYGGAAHGLEDARQREVLPLFRRGAAAESFAGIGPRLDRLEAEPGVRQQL
jgi:succinate-acetate transporter protein